MVSRPSTGEVRYLNVEATKQAAVSFYRREDVLAYRASEQCEQRISQIELERVWLNG